MSAKTELAHLIDRLPAARLLVIGDLMLDRFIYGTVDRISPEGPIPVLRIEKERSMLGGAGNVLRNLHSLGARTRIVAVIGDDQAGERVLELIGAESAEANTILRERGRSTTIKERYIAGGQQLLRADREDTGPLAEGTLRGALEQVRRNISACDLVILSDYGKGLLQGGLLREILAAAEQAGRPVVVDPKGRDYARYAGASLVTPNRRELHEATGLATGSDAEVVAACRHLIRQSGIKGVLATRSEQGMTLVASADAEALHLPAEAREVFDVSGAGDTVVATLGAAMAAGIALADAARLANVAAGIVVGKAGTAVAEPAEILHSLHAADLMLAENKVSDVETLLDRIAMWRRAGLKIGFTNGCFDLLHPGHVSLLRQARAACDRLIVGLNSDASVARLKGEGRPVQSEASRAAVLASLADVDQVVIFDEDTPLALIEAIIPDLLVKGADYKVEEVVGGDLVRQKGGQVLLARLEPDHSTTATLKRLRG